MPALTGLPDEERQMILDLIAQVRQRMLTPEKLREYDEHEIFPEAEVRELLSPEIGLQLLFLPQEYGGLGGGARDMAAVSEAMGKICLGVATAFLVVHLGSDPILVAGTDDQKRRWLPKVADGALVAYAVTEPEAGSNLSNLKTIATPVLDEHGDVTAYRLNGSKQFISSGAYADFLTVLAQTPEGPSFFVMETTAPGFVVGKPEQKHGIRSANTVALTFDNVLIPADDLVGGIPGQGLAQANEVFGYTRLMVASLALGAGLGALEKVVPYAKARVQFGSTLIEKQGYTHRLLVPHVARLEAARAYIDEVCARLDSGETDLQCEGAIAKLFTTETANACADAAIQALGGYGYVREYDVEKIKRDVKITTIYEGTSEIMQLIISTFRWRMTVQSKGAFYTVLAEQLDTLHQRCSDLKADVLAGLTRLLNGLFEAAHTTKATRRQHVMFQLASLAAIVETAAALTSRAADAVDPASEKVPYLTLCTRINTALGSQSAFAIAHEILYGSDLWAPADAQAILDVSGFAFAASQSGLISDMDALVGVL
ncbi:MAG: acyl-CoA dehydrogenase family protein [Thermoleophilia bacterium]|nr:acyl-CoA dehydrogenase family protein [Thermoleophilia bacterium]